jgi:hypothetical protein
MAFKAFDQSVPIRASPYASRLPDARDQAEANPDRVLDVAGELRVECAILKRRADHKQNHRD